MSTIFVKELLSAYKVQLALSIYNVFNGIIYFVTGWISGQVERRLGQESTVLLPSAAISGRDSLAAAAGL